MKTMSADSRTTINIYRSTKRDLHDDKPLGYSWDEWLSELAELYEEYESEN